MLFRTSSGWLVNEKKNQHRSIDFAFAEGTDADSFLKKYT